MKVQEITKVILNRHVAYTEYKVDGHDAIIFNDGEVFIYIVDMLPAQTRRHGTMDTAVRKWRLGL